MQPSNSSSLRPAGGRVIPAMVFAVASYPLCAIAVTAQAQLMTLPQGAMIAFVAAFVVVEAALLGLVTTLFD
jgi:hypothetical protein